MAVLNIYDINSKANEISNELLKSVEENPEDQSAVLFEEMRVLAVANRHMFKL